MWKTRFYKPWFVPTEATASAYSKHTDKLSGTDSVTQLLASNRPLLTANPSFGTLIRY